ncbi:P-loop containing nucleoside triphosphate hydrolases superfamily protein isoform X2 [Tasmannia lanceolata]|uniref:P-loop containing nucleoside triphosphate hydrolases superfamily protein isoform X2 n=1 Tax=Tasmannia lanceolata TaxID=3420 RepID=UPI0040642D8A
MDEPSSEGRKSRKFVERLTDSIKSLTGFKTYLTSSWAESVCNIIKDLPSDEPEDSSQIKGVSIKTVGSSENEDIETGLDLSKIQDDLAALKAHLDQLNLQRRRALNDFLDLKGNIRVFCRIRPLLAGEKSVHQGPVIVFDSSNVLLKCSENKKKSYSFDKVFNPGSSQDEVFSEVEPVIKSAMDGYNICIFAYGQTGTGKTFTMEGRPDCPGVVPCSIEALFKQAGDNNHKFIFTFSMLEIYMGSLRDLLVPQKGKLMDPTTQCLIRISITCFGAPDRQRETNKIWMVDLGGSERLQKTRAVGRRLEEGKAINLSLSALGDVISALQRKKAHVPYRNSKLTQVLRDSLSEDSKTLMLVHVSPKEEDLCETICSLGFAKRVRSIHLGHEESKEIEEAREVAMAELLQTVKHLEYVRQDVRKDIEKLNGKLKHLITSEPLSNEHLEDPFVLHEEQQSNKEREKHNTRNVTKGSTLQLPRFMRSTICSQHKSTADQKSSENTKNKEALTIRKRRPSSLRAASVTFPVNGISQSEIGSEIVGFNSKYSADYGTEFSHDTSECDIKMVVFPEQEKSRRDSLCSMSHTSRESIHELETRQAHKLDPQKCLTIENWLRIQKNKPTSTHIPRGKRVLATPLSEKKKQSTEQSFKIKEQELHCANTRNLDIVHEKGHKNDFTQKVVRNSDIIKELSDRGVVGESHKLVVTDVTQSSLDGFKVKDTGCKNPVKTYENEFGQTYETEFGNTLSVAFERAKQTEALVSNEIMVRKNNDEGNSYGSPQHMEGGGKPCLHLMRSRRPLFTDLKDAAWTDSALPVVKFQGGKRNTGICLHFGHTVLILCASALLGLGIRSLGLGHDFFDGLML